MLAGARIAVVVPAYDEAALIERTLASIPSYVDLVVVVDDASRDETFERARRFDDARVHVVRHAVNQGVGAAIVTGYREAFQRGADVAAVMAGDGQMHPNDLHSLLVPVVNGEADYTKGNRLDWPSARHAMPLTRYVGNHALTLLNRLSTGLPVRDSQCGYTALGRRAAERLPLSRLWKRYGFPNDMLAAAATANLRVTDVLVRPIYADEKSGIRVWHALFVIPFVLLRVALRRVHTHRRDMLSGPSNSFALEAENESVDLAGAAGR